MAVEFRRTFGQVFGLETTIAAVVFGLVAAAMIAAFLLSWHRRRRGRPPSVKAENNRLEIGYVAVLAGMAAFLVTTSLTSNAHVTSGPPAALKVRVTEFQWCWRFSYLGQPVTVTGQCASGLRPPGKLPVPGGLPTMVLPVGRPVQVEVTSNDVVHSFWVPALRYKIDAFPGHVNSFTLTLPHPGRWPGRCAEFCGLYHYGMDFYLQAVPPGQFASWMAAHGGSAATAGAR